MKGSYDVMLQSKLINYKFTIKRKITIIRGDSGTGKTTLLAYLDRAIKKQGVTLNCKAKCEIITGSYWLHAINADINRILFFEEDEDFLSTDEFASVVKKSNNYFVIISRDDLSNLPYSMDEIYEIRNSGKFNFLEPVYHHSDNGFSPTVVVTEDSNSGHTFLKAVCSGSKNCINAAGNSKIISKIKELNINNDRVLFFVDAAAFGPYINRLHQYILSDKRNEYYVLAPESFEYLLLSSEMFSKDINIKKKLEHPEEYIEPKHFSWENYFTDLILQITDQTNASYKKEF